MSAAAKIYPMQQGGGAFLVCVGAALMWAAFHLQVVDKALLAGFALGVVAIIVNAVWRSRQGLPRPAAWQLRLLWLAIGLEALAFWQLIPLVPNDDRLRNLATLGIVGAHFILMRWSFGWLIAQLGLAVLVLVAIGYFVPSLSTRMLVALDGGLDAAFGIALVLRGSQAVAAT